MMSKETIQCPDVEQIINTSDVSEAKTFLEHFNIPLPPSQYRID